MSVNGEEKAPARSRKPRAAAQPRLDTSELSPAELAQAVLSRALRPRVSEVRRLAEAVLAKAKKKKKKADGKRRKLSKIPGQKARK